MGPLLFLVYINDLPNASDIIFSLIFADDTNLFMSGNNLDELIDSMNVELVKITDWINCNKLSLNVSKTKYIVFNLPKKYLHTTRNLY